MLADCCGCSPAARPLTGHLLPGQVGIQPHVVQGVARNLCSMGTHREAQPAR